MASDSLHHLTLADLGSRLREGELSPVELTETLLDRVEALNGGLNAFRLVCRERALAEARAAEEALRTGKDLGPLHGIPYAVKDLYDVKGLPTTAGCKLLEDNVAAEDAVVVGKLGRAGMVLLGKTNTVQFAYGGVGINNHHGTPHNPWHRTHFVPGGSSSGSGVAVAAGMVPMALGSDTGGSVRIPAALCGTVGLKTTVGRIGRTGVFPLSWSLDTVGPLTRSVEDAALVYQAMQGEDPADETTRGIGLHDVLAGLKDGVRGLRVAFPESAFWEDLHPEVGPSVRDCGKVFQELGAHVFSIPFAEAEQARRLNSRGLAIAAEAYSLNRKWLEEHFDELDPLISTRMIRGKEITAVEYCQNFLEFRRLRGEAMNALRDVDVLLCPASAIPAVPVEEVATDLEVYTARNLQYLRNTYIGNLLNLCGLSVPCGFTGEGLPIGLMIYGKPFCEDTVLRAGFAFQQATDWHSRAPDLGWVSPA